MYYSPTPNSRVGKSRERVGWDGVRSRAGEWTCLELPGKEGASLVARQTLGRKAPWAKWVRRQAWVLLEGFCEQVLCSPREQGGFPLFPLVSEKKWKVLSPAPPFSTACVRCCSLCLQ